MLVCLAEWKNKEPLTVFPPNPRCPPPKEEPKEPRRESLQLTVFPANPKEAGSKGPAKESKEPRAPAQLSVFPVNPVVAAAREKALQEQNGSQGLAGLATAVVQGITSAFTTSKEEPLQTTSGEARRLISSAPCAHTAAGAAAAQHSLQYRCNSSQAASAKQCDEAQPDLCICVSSHRCIAP